MAQPRWPEGLTELASIIEESLKGVGYEQDERLKITETTLKAMAFLAGGRTFYLPRGKKLESAIRNFHIFQEFTGDNVPELARKHSLTEVQIYSILRSQRELAKTASGETGRPSLMEG